MSKSHQVLSQNHLSFNWLLRKVLMKTNLHLTNQFVVIFKNQGHDFPRGGDRDASVTIHSSLSVVAESETLSIP